MRRTRRGSNAVEFALLFPVVALLVLGTLQWAFYFIKLEAVTLAAQAGVKAGSRTRLADNPVAAARARAAQSLAGTYPFSVPAGTTYTGSLVDGDIVTVTVTVPTSALVNISMITTPSTIRARARMQLDKP